MFRRKHIVVWLTIMLAWMVTSPILSADACSTCGCSELCALGMLQETSESSKSKSLLSESIWGSIILKMAYKRDQRLQKLSRRMGSGYEVANLNIFAVSGGTLAQNIISQTTLNPPEGQSDSYLPGSLGLGMTSLLTLGFGGQTVWRLAIQRK